MPAHPTLRAFNFENWIKAHQHLLQPPVSNKMLHTDTGMIVMVVGGPNGRMDFHDDPVEEWFFQYRGNMVLKIAEGGKIFDVPIRQGEVFFLPAHVRHAPQRPEPGSIGIVVESPRMFGMKEAFEWYCFECGALVHRIEAALTAAAGIVTQLPQFLDDFRGDQAARTCPDCGVLHPGKGVPPPSWAVP
jgi:3-hydroxyanthranilate 3,4-dioxygenase